MGISAFLITYNEEQRISRALDSVAWADERIVVDGGSSDHTVAICKAKGANVFHRPFDNFERQKNYALSLTNQEWVFSLDGDEWVPPSLGQEIRAVAHPGNPVAGYWISRHNYFLGKPLRFGPQGQERLLRLFRKKLGGFVGMVHETVRVNGPVGTLKHGLEHEGTRTLGDYWIKLNLYTDLEAASMMQGGSKPSWLKTVFFPPGKWVLNYLFLGGFLDGWNGFLYHGLSCYYDWLKNFKARAVPGVVTQ